MQRSIPRVVLRGAAVFSLILPLSSLAPAQDLAQPSAQPDTAAALTSRPLPPRSAPSRATPAPSQTSQVDSLSGTQAATGSWSWQRTAMVCVVGSAMLIMLVYGSRRFRESSRFMLALGPAGRAPSGVLEVLGRYPAGRGTLLILLRLDRRVLLVAQSGGRTGTGMTTLCEIDDPASVASLLAKRATTTRPHRSSPARSSGRSRYRRRPHPRQPRKPQWHARPSARPCRPLPPRMPTPSGPDWRRCVRPLRQELQGPRHEQAEFLRPLRGLPVDRVRALRRARQRTAWTGHARDRTPRASPEPAPSTTVTPRPFPCRSRAMACQTRSRCSTARAAR